MTTGTIIPARDEQETTRGGLRSRFAVPVLAALAVVDLLLAAASVITLLGPGGAEDESPWLLETDGGWAELFGYAQEAVLALLLVSVAWRTRRLIWAAWALLFAGALADDSLRLHENYGSWLADRLEVHLGFPERVAGLRLNDFGEIAVWGVLAVVPVVAIAVLHRRLDRSTRRADLGMAALATLFIFCGAVVDQMHVLAMGGPLDIPLGTLEDGGELLALSAMIAYVVALLRAGGRREVPTGQRPSASASSSPA